VSILPSTAETLLELFFHVNCIQFCPHIILNLLRLDTSNLVNTVQWLVSMHAIQVVVVSILTIFFGFANRDDTFGGSAFCGLLKNFLV